ncbi:MAG: GntR family transcriptional regulator [Hyphomicrobiaceae bacterium]|nr:GntR family transcriptional regulator [Hyphomicrobiaceae bacterium]
MTFSNRPLYLQVRDALAERIASGGLLPGAAIPSEGDLAREIGVSAGTVRKALQMMETDRLIVRQQGRGTFVSDPCSAELATRFTMVHGPDGERVRGQLKSSEIARGAAGEVERDRLQLAAGDDVYRLKRVRMHRGAPFAVEESVLPADLFPGLEARRETADQIAALAHEYGVLLGNARERVYAAAPPVAVANMLGTAPGTHVVVLDRVLVMMGGRRPVEWRLAHVHLPGGYYLAEIR